MRIVSVLCVLLGAAVAAGETPPPNGNSALARLAASMQPGDWKELKTEGLTKDLTVTSKGYQIVTWGDDGAWDSKRGQFLFMGFRQELKFINYSEQTNTWTLIPSYESKVVFGHPYGTNAFNEEGGFFYNLENGTNQVHAYDVKKHEWSNLPPCPFPCQGLGLAIEYFPDMKSLIFLYQRSAYKFDTVENKWSQLGKDLPIGNAHVLMHYNARYKCMYMLGGNDRDSAVVVLDAAGKIIAKRDAPIKIGMNVPYAAALPDPATGDVIVLSAKDDFYAWDPEADTWTRIGNSTKDTPFKTIGAIGAAIPEYNVILWADLYGSERHVWLYKHKKSVQQSIK